MAAASAWPTAPMGLPAQSLRCGSLAPRRSLDVARRWRRLAPAVGATPVRPARRTAIRPGPMGSSVTALDPGVVIALGGNGIDGFAAQALQVAAEVLAQLRVAQGELHGGLQVAQLASAVIALAHEAVGVNGLFLHQRRNAVGQLDLAARALPDLLQVLENRRFL